MLRLDVNAIDYAIIAVYFLVVLGIGFAARRYIKTSLDYFLSGRSLPAWVTGLAFVSANLGALELLASPPTAPSTASPACTSTGSARSPPWSSWGS
jgi:Na+/proline symporter